MKVGRLIMDPMTVPAMPRSPPDRCADVEQSGLERDAHTDTDDHERRGVGQRLRDRRERVRPALPVVSECQKP